MFAVYASSGDEAFVGKKFQESSDAVDFLVRGIQLLRNSILA